MSKIQQKKNARTTAPEVEMKRTGTKKSEADPAPCQSRKSKSNKRSPARGRRQTKQARILELLQRPRGASITDLTKATGWQPHSIRAALTGLRKKDHEVVHAKDEGGIARYHIVAEA